MSIAVHVQATSLRSFQITKYDHTVLSYRLVFFTIWRLTLHSTISFCCRERLFLLLQSYIASNHKMETIWYLFIVVSLLWGSETSSLGFTFSTSLPIPLRSYLVVLHFFGDKAFKKRGVKTNAATQYPIYSYTFHEYYYYCVLDHLDRVTLACRSKTPDPIGLGASLPASLN